MSFNFTGFDNNNYKIFDLPSFIYEYNYYLIIRFTEAYRLICFNNEITFKLEGDKILINCPEGSTFIEFGFNGSSETWGGPYTHNQLSLYSGFYPIYSSENLLEYKYLIVTNNFTLPVPETQLNVYTLSPIVEEIDKKDNIVESAFTEVFSILPVLIVVLVSFIGIRKAISWLFSLLKHS